MKKHDFGKPLCRLITAVAIMMLSLQAMAYDFSYTHQGKTLSYHTTSENTVEVTYYSSISNNYVSGDVVIPSTVWNYSVTSIGDSAFRGCSGLTSVTIPNSVTSIGRNAFYDCSGLSSVTIPTGVTSIGKRAFYNCRGLTTLNFNAINCQDFEAYYDDVRRTFYLPFSGTSLITVNIGDSVQHIPANFVRGCSDLTSVSIPNSVTSIGRNAFYDCSRLTSVSIPNSITSIEGYTFSGCSSLTSVIIPNSVTSIGECAFESCRGLTSITIPNSVTSIGGGAFQGCRGLSTLNFNAINCHFSVYVGFCPFDDTSLTTVNIGDSVQRIPENFVRDCRGLTSISIPNSVTSIEWGAFRGCSGLTSVTIPTGVTFIGKMAFVGCSGLTTLNFNAINCQDFEVYYNSNVNYPFSGTSLTTVDIGDSVQRIPANFVRDCRGLTSVTIGNNVTSIGYRAFSDCSGLTSITIPTGVTSIEGYTFYGCSGLASITIPTGVTSIGNSAFEDCSGLTSVTIPNSVTSIGSSAFSGCSGLVSVVIGDGITNIGGDIFGDCPYLTYLTIGRSVESIENGAFLNCSLLSQITSWASVPPEIGGIEAFPYPNFCTVTVPCGSLEAYTTPTCRWNIFFPQRITESSSFELSVSANDEAYGRVEVETQSCNVKTLTAIANNGYEFTGWNDGNTENPRTVTLTSDTTFMAIFAVTETTPTITVTVNDATMGSASYTLDGNTAVLTATPNEGYEFTGWNDGNMENPRTVTVTSDTAFVAIFTETETAPTITETVNDATMGSATYTLDGNTAVLTATPNEGYEFTGWNDGNTENPRTVTVTSDTAFTAIFAETETTPTITVTVNDATMGSATYTLDGNTAVLTATPNEGYRFLTWNDGNTENPRTVTVTSDTAFMAIFTETETTPTITVTVNDAMMGSATYTMDGNTAVLTATPNEGYRFLTWNDGNTENPRTVTVTSDTAFTAIFTETETTPTITVTVNDATMGSATYTMDGNTAVLTATPNEGYRFLTWSDGNMENPRTVTVTSDTTFMAIFTASGSSSLQGVNTREFALYPNPAKSFVTLEFEALQENASLQILDINGRRVRTLDLKAGVETLRIDLGDLPKGVYTIMLGNTTKKLIVE